jgi:CubicO group peptidase (beta-lactamase class C family)
MTRLVLYLIILFSVTANCRAQTTEELIRNFMDEGNVPGLFVAVVKGDSLIYRNSVGLADKENNVPISGNTCMELGSISKLFTAEVIYGLQEKHLLNVNDKISQYFQNPPKAWSDITIQHLLNHTSGIKNYLLDPRFKAREYFTGIKSPSANHFFMNVTRDSMVQLFYSLPVEFKPGTSWSYSNTGYYLLGVIAETITGKDFSELIRENITLPVVMQHTGTNEWASAKGWLAKGYLPSDTGLRLAPILTTNYALSAGAFAASGDDMIKYLKAIHKRTIRKEILFPDSAVLNEMPFTYCNGRFYSDFHGMTVISHNGGTSGFSSSWINVPGENISIIILINLQDFAAIDQLAWDILAEFEPTIRYPVNRVLNEEGSKYAQKILEVMKSLRTNTSYPDELAEPLRLFLDSENGKGLWNWYFERGFPETAYCVDIETKNKSRIYRYRLPLIDKIEYRMTIVTGEKNKIIQMLWW